MTIETICRSAEDTQDFATNFAKQLPKDSSVALIGPMGCGKTTFVKGMAIGLGIFSNINSPTYNIFHMHEGPVNLLHVDAYRLDGSERSKNGLMIDDFLISPYCLVVEWPELLYGFLKNCDFKISIEILDDQSRKISRGLPLDPYQLRW